MSVCVLYYHLRCKKGNHGVTIIVAMTVMCPILIVYVVTAFDY